MFAIYHIICLSQPSTTAIITTTNNTTNTDTVTNNHHDSRSRQPVQRNERNVVLKIRIRRNIPPGKPLAPERQYRRHDDPSVISDVNFIESYVPGGRELSEGLFSEHEVEGGVVSSVLGKVARGVCVYVWRVRRGRGGNFGWE